MKTLNQAKVEALWVINKEYKKYRECTMHKYDYATIVKNSDETYDIMFCEVGNLYNHDNIVCTVTYADLNIIYSYLRDCEDTRFLTKKEIKEFIETLGE